MEVQHSREPTQPRGERAAAGGYRPRDTPYGYRKEYVMPHVEAFHELIRPAASRPATSVEGSKLERDVEAEVKRAMPAAILCDVLLRLAELQSQTGRCKAVDGYLVGKIPWTSVPELVCQTGVLRIHEPEVEG